MRQRSQLAIVAGLGFFLGSSASGFAQVVPFPSADNGTVCLVNTEDLPKGTPNTVCDTVPAPVGSLCTCPKFDSRGKITGDYQGKVMTPNGKGNKSGLH